MCECSVVSDSLWPHRLGPLSMGFPRQETGACCHPFPGDLPNPGIKPEFSCISCTGRQILYHCTIWKAQVGTHSWMPRAGQWGWASEIEISSLSLPDPPTQELKWLCLWPSLLAVFPSFTHECTEPPGALLMWILSTNIHLKGEKNRFLCINSSKHNSDHHYVLTNNTLVKKSYFTNKKMKRVASFLHFYNSCLA